MPLAIVGQHQFDSQAKASQEAAKKAQSLNPIQPRPRTVREILTERERLTASEQRWSGKLADSRSHLDVCKKRLKQVDEAIEQLQAEPPSTNRDVRIQQYLGGEFFGATGKVHKDGERDRLLARQAVLQKEVSTYIVAANATRKLLKEDWPSDQELADAKRLESL